MTSPSSPASRLDRVRKGRERESAFYEAVLGRGAVVAWGDDEGLSPWEDDDGQVLVPLWPDEESAEQENAGQSEEGESPIRLPLEELADKLRRWQTYDVDAVAVHPVAGHIAATLTLTDFARRLLTADQASGGRLGDHARRELASLAPRLP